MSAFARGGRKLAGPAPPPASAEPGLRLDKWLFFARFVKHRGLAGELIKKRRVRLNNRLVDKAHCLVRPGDVLTLGLPQGVVVARVAALGERRGPASEARALYEAVELERAES